MKQLRSVCNSLLSWYRGLTARERYVLVPLAALSVAAFVLYRYAVLPLGEAYTAQSEELARLEEDLKTLPFVLNRYARLMSRKGEIEKEYEAVEIAEGERTFLEKVVQEKVGTAVGFEANPRQALSFGGNYQQIPFSVRFNANSLQSVVDFLREVALGKKRLLLTKIDISKGRNNDRFEVDIDVTSIRRIASDEAGTQISS